MCLLLQKNRKTPAFVLKHLSFLNKDGSLITKKNFLYLYNEPRVKRELFALLISFDDLISVKFTLIVLQKFNKYDTQYHFFFF